MDLKILASHPVHYHVPFFRALVNRGIEIDVRYYHQGTAGRAALDRDFGIAIEWDLDLLSGYSSHICLEGVANYSLSEQIRILPCVLAWALRERDVPLLLVGWATEVVWLTWLLRVLGHLPVMVFSETTPQSFGRRPKPPWQVKLLRKLLQHSHALLYIGQRNRLFYEQMGVAAERLFFTPYSIDNDRFITETDLIRSQKRELKLAYGLNPDLPVFLFCGKLIPKKRPLELLDGYLQAGLQDQVQLVYVGEGSLRTEIESRIAKVGINNVHLLGFLNQSQIPLAYLLADVFCLLSDSDETWGLVVNEALVCGLPVIVSDAAGCGPDLVSNENGWGVPLDDMNQLIKTLQEVYDRQADWPQMGAVGRQKVAIYDHRTMVTGVCDALKFIELSSR